MIDWIKRAAAGHLLRLSGRPQQNRQRLYGGRTGLRILTLHAMEGREVEHFKAIVDWCATRFELARLSDVDELVEGRFHPGKRDKLLFSFDDGHARDYPVAEWLADQGIHAIFFVIPSWVVSTFIPDFSLSAGSSIALSFFIVHSAGAVAAGMYTAVLLRRYADGIGFQEVFHE